MRYFLIILCLFLSGCGASMNIIREGTVITGVKTRGTIKAEIKSNGDVLVDSKPDYKILDLNMSKVGR